MAFGEKEGFKKQWSELHLREILSDQSKPASDADILRTILTQVDYARAEDIVDNESAQSLTRQYYQKYIDLVDTPEENGGLNNYADSILTKIEGLKNESQEWKISLTLDNISGWKCVQNLKQTSQAALDSLIPKGKENVSLQLNSEPRRKQSTTQPLKKRQFENSVPKNTMCLKQAALKQNPGPCNINLIKEQTNTRESGHTEKTHLVKKQDALFQQHVSVRNNMPSIRTNNEHVSVANSGTCQPNLLPSDSATTSFWNMGQTSDDMSGSLRNPSNDYSHNNLKGFQEQHVPQQNSVQEEEPRKNSFRSFKTAREQLDIDNQKKFGRSRNDQQSTLNQGTYGTSKKSLGTRRGLNSKFVPPVMNRDSGDDDGGTLVRKVGANKAGPSGDQGDEPMDERLKNIEQKMVELIMSEIMDHGPPITWDDIAGLAFAKKTIKEIVVWPMLRPDIFTGLRGPPKGLLLFGPPGTGKTLIGKCIASQSKSTFFSISASSLTSKWVGEGEKMVRALFAVARVHQPAVVFMDEIDSLLSQRSDNEHESSRRIKTEFLVQLDGATSGDADRILIVGATNRPQEIDEAARRRFVKRLYIPLPEAIARRQIVQNLMSQQKYHLEERELQLIEDKSQGYSGSDMANLCREAALGPIRSVPFEEIEHITADQVRPILYEDFEAAFTQVRASVSEKDLELYITWNKQYGSWDFR